MSKNSPLKVDPGLILGQVGNIAGGLTSIASGIIGSKQRRQEERNAQGEFDKYRKQFESTDTSNPYSNMQNTYEDLTVNTQAADFTAQQQAQGQANIMNQMSGAAGGSGIAALAQAMAGQQAQAAQSASVSIGQQERQNLMAERGMANQLQTMDRQGDMLSRQMQQRKIDTLMGMGAARLGAAQEARQQAKQAVVGGVGQLFGAAGNVMAEDSRRLYNQENFNDDK
tara:strand:- start:988 stop:1665 length:678 start_codon:yes stop_codon:yes gene_type:complete